MKSLLSKQNLYNIPSELDAYRPFLDNTDINISWIDWKNKGEAFDIEDNVHIVPKSLIYRNIQNKNKFLKIHIKKRIHKI